MYTTTGKTLREFDSPHDYKVYGRYIFSITKLFRCVSRITGIARRMAFIKYRYRDCAAGYIMAAESD